MTSLRENILSSQASSPQLSLQQFLQRMQQRIPQHRIQQSQSQQQQIPQSHVFTTVLPFKNFRTKIGKSFNDITIDEIINGLILAWRMDLSSDENYQILDNMFRDIKFKIKTAFIDNIPNAIDDEKIMSIILNNSEQLSKKFIIDARSIKGFNNNSNNNYIKSIIQPYIKQI